MDKLYFYYYWITGEGGVVIADSKEEALEKAVDYFVAKEDRTPQSIREDISVDKAMERPEYNPEYPDVAKMDIIG